MVTNWCFFISAYPQRRCNQKVDLVFVLDSSGSIQDQDPNGWKKILRFTTDIIRRLRSRNVDLRVGVVVFSAQVKLRIRLNQYTDMNRLIREIENQRYLGQTTNTMEAIRVMYTEAFSGLNGARRDAMKIAVTITDGVPNLSDGSPAVVRPLIPYVAFNASMAQSRGITMFAIGIGLLDFRQEVLRQFGRTTLHALASPPAGKHTFFIKDFSALNGIVDSTMKSISGACGSVTATTKAPSECCMNYFFCVDY